MPQRTDEFQRLIYMITASLAEGSLVKESAMVKETISGEEREVDVLIETRVAGHKVAIAIEVNRKARKADKPWVEGMLSKHNALPTDKLVLVSKAGFFKPALARAKREHIDAFTVEEALDADWKYFAELTKAGFLGLVEISYSCAAVYTPAAGQLTQVDLPLNAPLFKNGNTLPVGYLTHNLLHKQEVRAFLQDQAYDTDQRDFWFSYREEGIAFSLGDDRRNLEELRVGLKVAVSKTPIQVTLGRYGGNAFLHGSSTDSGKTLQYVMIRRGEGNQDGMLLDESGLRILKPAEP